MKKHDLTLDQALEPLLQCSIPLSEQLLLFNAMFTAAVCNAPDNETDNFTAKQLSPFYLAMCETLQNLQKV